MAHRLVDRVLAAALLVLCGPLFVAVALAERLTGDRGPLLYRAPRIGEGGRPIRVLKLRTMRHPPSGPPLTTARDPRITRLGRLLRTTKLDELPQLVNVVRGEMALVGPRPEAPELVSWSDPLQAEVARARPGMTGLAQLRFAHEEELHLGPDPMGRYRHVIQPRKLRLDRWYLQHRSTALDGWILLRTVAAVLGLPPRNHPRRPGSAP